MSFKLEKVSIDSYYGNLLLGLFDLLENNPRIKNVTLQQKQGLKSQNILNWEQLNGVKLPQDLKNFYLSTNGFELTWSYSFGPETLPVGNITMVPLHELIRLTGYDVVDHEKIEVYNNQYHLRLSEDSKVFQLSNIDDESKVCLVYHHPNLKPKIWFADEELNWHFLSHCFKNYFKMSIYHLGIPYWQYCFTPQGIPTWVEQIILMESNHIVKALPYEVTLKKTDEQIKFEKNKKLINKIDPDILNPLIDATKCIKEKDNISKYNKKKT